MKVRKIFFGIGAALLYLLVPIIASAHEVYVLTPSEIKNAVSMSSPNPFGAIPLNELQFLLWGAIVVIIILVALRLSTMSAVKKACNPFLIRIKKYASLVGRLTLGISLMASGYYNAFFGPELPIPHMIVNLDKYFHIVLLIIGFLIAIGLFTRLAAFVALLAFGLAVYFFQAYMLNYVNYLGEIVLVLVLGGNILSFDRLIGWETQTFKKLSLFWEKYAFLILRICFGVALFFASFYAKFLHSNLALDTVADYHLTNYFHFTPLFLVLGAFIIETLLGLFFALGFEVRLAAIFFTFFLTLSLLFFGEVVWPHIILLGVNIALFMHGYDKYTLERVIFKKSELESVL